MWQFLSFLVAPKSFYERTGRWLPWLGGLAVSLLITGALWGLYFAPPDYQQGDAFRMLYVHVPAAFLSMALYAFMGVLSLSLLVWRVKLAGVLLRSVASIGASMALLALFTGSLWGKPMWGTWWIWDARLTSELVLFLLYVAILTLQHTYQNPASGDKLVAILTLVGLIDLPIIHYSVYWWNTLHQGATLTVFAKPKIGTDMLYPLLIMLAGFVVYATWMMLLKSRNLVLLRERRSQWVQRLVKEKQHES